MTGHSTELGAASLAAFTVGALVDEIAARLAGARLPESRAEARDLVAALVGQSRFWPSVHASERVSDALVARARAAAAQRAEGVPFAYCVGVAAFRHLSLHVDPRVLIPRQETEVLVDLVLRADRRGVAADVGTGSGAIALALATEGRFTRVVATDAASDALSVARQNAAHYRDALNAPVEFRCGSALAPLAAGEVDVCVCNPPYVAFSEALELPAQVRDWEPALALFCGDDGLAVTREVALDIPRVVRPGGLVAFEVDTRRASQVAILLSSVDKLRDVRVYNDLTGRERFVLATRT